MRLSYPVCCPDAREKVMAWCEEYEEAFPFLKRAGYEGIELLVRDPDTVDTVLLRRLLEENSLILSAVGTTPMQKEDHLFLMDKDPDRRKEAVRRLYGLIDLGAEFQAPVLIGKYRGMTKEAAGCHLSDLAKVIREADRRAGEKGILLLLEPQNASNINNLNRVEEAVSWIRENRLTHTKLLMDIFHMNVTEESIRESLRKYRDYAGMIHMADSGRLVPGYGSIDMASVLETLDVIGFGGFLSMEIKQDPDTKTVAALSALSLRYLELESRNTGGK